MRLGSGAVAKVGIISDTHDNLNAIDQAVRRFDEEGVELVLHAGDWNAPFALARMARVKAKLVGVFGNVDGDLEALTAKAKEVRVELLGEFGVVEVGGLRVAILHGKDARMVEAVAKSGLFDAVVRGHTHQPKLEEVGRVLVINPGEACGYLTGKRSIAILDTETRSVKLVSL